MNERKGKTERSMDERKAESRSVRVEGRGRRRGAAEGQKAGVLGREKGEGTV